MPVGHRMLDWESPTTRHTEFRCPTITCSSLKAIFFASLIAHISALTNYKFSVGNLETP